ncbi:outer membrane beta-barrel protein [Sphingomonas sp. MMS24-JH45]
MPIDPAARFNAKERSYAAYISGKFAFDLGAIAWTAPPACARSSRTGAIVGDVANNDANGVVTAALQTVRQDYVDVLPSLNMRVRFTDKLQLRLGYTHTRTQPEFGQLNPALTISRTQPGSAQQGGERAGGRERR